MLFEPKLKSCPGDANNQLQKEFSSKIVLCQCYPAGWLRGANTKVVVVIFTSSSQSWSREEVLALAHFTLYILILNVMKISTFISIDSVT